MTTEAAPVSDTSSIGVAVVELSKLSESQRQALGLRFNQGLTFAEIAEFIEVEPIAPFQEMNKAVLQRVAKDLWPAAWTIFAKLTLVEVGAMLGNVLGYGAIIGRLQALLWR